MSGYFPTDSIGGMYNYGFYPVLGSRSSSTSSREVVYKSREDKELADIEKARRDSQEIQELLSQRKVLNAAQDELQSKSDSISNAVTTNDGGKIVTEDVKKMSFGQKLLRGLGNAVKGIGNLCKSFVGIEKDGSWNPLKCIRNVAITAAAVATAIYAPPLAIAAAKAIGLKAGAAAAVGTAVKLGVVTLPTYVALGAGVYKAGKGIYDATKAKTTAEFDQATQEAGQGAFVAGFARMGLKGINKAAGVNATGKTYLGKVGAFWKNTFISPFKAAHVEAKAMAINATEAKNLFKSAATEANGKSKRFGFWKTFKAAKAGENKLHANVINKEFQVAYEKATESLNKNLQTIDAQLSKATAGTKEYVVLENQKAILMGAKDKLATASNRADWKALRSISKEIESQTKPYKWYDFGKTYEIKGQTFTKSELKQAFKGFDKKLGREMREVSRLKFDTMRKLAKYEEHKNTVESFGYSTNKYSRVTNWYNSRLDKGFTKGEMAMGLFNGSILVSEPYYILSPVLKQPAPALVSMFWNPVYDDPEGIKVSIDEYNKTINDVENAKKELQAGLNDVDKRIESLG